MILFLRVHYKKGPLLNYIEAEGKSSRNLDSNYEYGYLVFKNGMKIKTTDIQNVEYVWKEVPPGQV